MIRGRELLLFVACIALGFAAARVVDAVASDCRRIYSPDPPYPLEGGYPFVEPEDATIDGDSVDDIVPYNADAWLPPLVKDPSSWRLEGDDPAFTLVLEAAQ